MKTKLVLPLLLLLYLALNLFCVFNESPIWDEGLQLDVGRLFWQTREFILEPVEPPFARLLTSLPVMLFGQSSMTGILGKVYFWPRLMVILTGCLFLVLFFNVLKDLFGNKFAVIGSLLFIFEPSLLTHSHYNTTDFIFTSLFFISFYLFAHFVILGTIGLQNPFLSSSFWEGALRCRATPPESVIHHIEPYQEPILDAVRWIYPERSRRTPDLTRMTEVVSLPIFLALLFTTKISGPPLFFLTAVALLLLNPVKKIKIKKNRIISFILIFLLTFWAVYLFKTGPAIGKNTASTGKPYTFYIFENKPFWLKIFKLPLPFIDYLATLKYAIQYQKAGHDAYFAGYTSRFGWWWYFPVIFLIKTPLPLVFLFLTGLLSCFGRTKDKKLQQLVKPFLIPIAVIFFMSLFVKINIGLRHILPVYPFIVILALYGFIKIWKIGLWGKILCSLLLWWYFSRTLYFLPHPITFTNEILPPNRSYQVLADSNLSWGQELIAISRWQKMSSHPVSQSSSFPIDLFYFGNTRVENYLSNFTRRGCDDYVTFKRLIRSSHDPILISATCLQIMAGKYSRNILLIKPKHIIANSILVY